jgi:hypothetical protein
VTALPAGNAIADPADQITCTIRDCPGYGTAHPPLEQPHCTGCEHPTEFRIPWGRDRLCLTCMDLQLNLMALAIEEVATAA